MQAIKGPIQVKTRLDSTLSKLSPPPNAPVWAIDQSFLHQQAKDANPLPRDLEPVTSTGVTLAGSSNPARRRLNTADILQAISVTSEDAY